ncbi:MAG: S8 family peptidase [Salinivirgaceae bacterium]|nr:S8 family peptidase [Salinivirgaceae bacterium]
MKKINIKLIILLILLISQDLVSQELYYWSGGNKVELEIDYSTMVIYEEENFDISLNRNYKINTYDNLNAKDQGNYKIIKFKESQKSNEININNKLIRSKSFGLKNKSNENIFLSHIILLKVKLPYSYEDLSLILNKYNSEYLSTEYDVIKVSIEDIRNVLRVSNEIFESGIVEWCHPDFLISSERNLVGNEKQYYIHNKNHYCGAFGNDINVIKAWEITKGCENIIVAILDDGVEDHPDLKDENGNSRVLSGYTASGTNDHGSPDVSGDHGQACAGIIAASHNSNIKGIAPNVKILPIKIPLSKASPTSVYANAINWAWKEGNADVLSNSWGDGNYDAVFTAIANAHKYGRGGNIDTDTPGLGAIVVCSSGNKGLSSVNAMAKRAIAVGAINKKDEPAEKNTGGGTVYTNSGPKLDLVAYGGDAKVLNNYPYSEGDIRTIDRVGNLGYNSGNYNDHFCGTSAACPQVSGAAALVLSVNPNLSRVEVEEILFSNATDLGASGRDDTYGHGKLNIYNSVKESVETLGQQVYFTEGYLSLSMDNSSVKRVFSASPGCGISAAAYICDVYRATATISNSSSVLYVGDGLSGANPNNGEYYVNIENEGSDINILTFFYYIKKDMNDKTINKWVPFNPYDNWPRKYISSPQDVVTDNSTINSGQTKNIFAKNTVKLTYGFKAYSGSNVKIFITANSNNFECIPKSRDIKSIKSLQSINSEVVVSQEELHYLKQEKNIVLLYPNPTDKFINIELTDDEIYSYSIIAINGTTVKKQENISGKTSIDLSDQKNGIYYIEITKDDEIIREKIIKM